MAPRAPSAGKRRCVPHAFDMSALLGSLESIEFVGSKDEGKPVVEKKRGIRAAASSSMVRKAGVTKVSSRVVEKKSAGEPGKKKKEKSKARKKRDKERRLRRKALKRALASKPPLPAKGGEKPDGKASQDVKPKDSGTCKPAAS
ncbi:hypothetical protein B0T20DRAFT_491362 [Sordaria brevicollis]|uniref:Uncharacterized protein n=1 Tax=Sordaria brevicollis TaxID=83679 RepID=A0AAE0NVC2_SORBR|nr:hypothetical protein B0T20DRAFT_491362 [Sordaria brevicollis]